MKIGKDFGVRALLAVIAAAGYYIMLIVTIAKFNLSEETVVALLASAASPWLLAMGFYFGSHIATKENGQGQPGGSKSSGPSTRD